MDWVERESFLVMSTRRFLHLWKGLFRLHITHTIFVSSSRSFSRVIFRLFDVSLFVNAIRGISSSLNVPSGECLPRLSFLSSHLHLTCLHTWIGIERESHFVSRLGKMFPPSPLQVSYFSSPVKYANILKDEGTHKCFRSVHYRVNFSKEKHEFADCVTFKYHSRSYNQKTRIMKRRKEKNLFGWKPNSGSVNNLCPSIMRILVRLVYYVAIIKFVFLSLLTIYVLRRLVFFKIGCNVENAAYTIGICAERVAAVKAVSEGKMDFIAVAISSRISNDFIGPCGACRQFLVEFNPDIKVFLTKPDGSYKDTSMRELLPMTFTAEQLFSVTKDGLKKENSK